MSTWWWCALGLTTISCGILLVGLAALSRATREIELELVHLPSADLRDVAERLSADRRHLRDDLDLLPR